MTQRQVAQQFINEYLEIQIPLPIGNVQKAVSVSMDWTTAKTCALISLQKLQDNQAKPPVGYVSPYDYWEGVKNEMKKL